MKLFWTWVAALLAVAASASDLERGVTFTDGQRLTAANLHSLIDDTSISVQFYTGQDSQSTLPTADYFLVYSASALAFKKMTASGVLYGNTALITGQTEKTAPSTNDYVLLYDTTGAVLKKASLANIGLNSTNLINWQPEVTNLLSSAYLLALNGGTNVRVSSSNLFWSLETWNKPFTNLLTHTAPTNEDRLLLWDSKNGTNKSTTLAGLFTNLPSGTVSNTDVLMSVRAGTGVVQQVTLSAVATLISNLVVYPSGTNTATVAEFAIPAVSTAVTNTHTLGTTPAWVRWVLVCKTNDQGYLAGDEIDIGTVGLWSSTDQAGFSTWANSSNAGVVRFSAATSLEVAKRTAGVVGDNGALTEARWRVKGYLRP